MRIHFSILLIVFMFATGFTMAQSDTTLSLGAFKQKRIQVSQALEKKGILYTKELNFFLKFRTNGWGIGMEFVRFRNVKLKRLMQIEYAYYLDFKQQRRRGVGPGNSGTFFPSRYIFGKQNNFWTLRFNYGYRREIAEKAKVNGGVKLALVYVAGVSLGIIKPYYLNIVSPSNPFESIPERYTGNNADRFLDVSKISGYAGFRFGWNEIQPAFGGHAKIGLNLDFGKTDRFVKAIEAGVELDVFHRKIPILITPRNNKPYLISFYLVGQLGWRKN